MKIHKILFLAMVMILLIGIGTINASDTNTSADSVISDNSDSNVDDFSSISKESETIKSEVKTIDKQDSSVLKSNSKINKVEGDKNNKTSGKSLKKEDDITVNNDNFNSYFTSSGFASNVSDGANISFASDVASNTSVLINKRVNINGNGYTLTLNSSSLTIGNDGSNSKVSNIILNNTQVYIRNSTGVVLDNITNNVANTSYGKNEGVFSIRDNSSFITIQNSHFYTENSNGISTLVLCVASNCTINNNTFQGVGQVGNLLYLTTYHGIVDEDDPLANSGNNIINNILVGTEDTNSLDICYCIALTGHSNIVANNSIYYTDSGIAVEYGYDESVLPSDTSSKYKGNYYYNNTLYNGASFRASTNSTVSGNIITGSALVNNSIFADNTVMGQTGVFSDSVLSNNYLLGNVAVIGSNVLLENNSINQNVTINKKSSNATLNNNNIAGSISGSYNGSNNKEGATGIPTGDAIIVGNYNFNSYFTADGFTSNVSDGANIIFAGDVSSNASILINKKVNINGSSHTLTLNSNSLTIDKGGSYSKISGIVLNNTQVYIRNSIGVVIDNITNNVVNTPLGQNTGVFSIRDNSSFITVQNSRFYTANNTGRSTLVLAVANNCTINNNTVQGAGIVGNLIYLTTYNSIVDDDDPLANSGNNITNNIVIGPEQVLGICYCIALTGYSNNVANNSIYYSGSGIDVEYGYDESVLPDDAGGKYKGNYYYNNTLYNGAYFRASINSTVSGNIISGSLDYVTNSTVANNIVLGETTVSSNSVLSNNYLLGNVIVSGSNVLLENNYINQTVAVNKNLNNVTLNGNNITGSISGSYNGSNNKEGTTDIPTMITPTNVPSQVSSGTTIRIFANITTLQGSPIDDVVDLYVAIDGETHLMTFVVGSLYEYFYDTTEEGNLTIAIEFKGMGNYLASTTSKNLEVIKSGNQNDTRLTLDAPSMVNINDTVNVRGVLYEASSGKGIGVAKIIVSVDGVNHTVLTDGAGGYSYSFAANKSGEYNIIVCFKGNDKYYQSSNSTSFNVEAIGSYLTLDYIADKFTNSNFTVSGQLLDASNNNPISNASVSVWINGTSSIYNVYTGSDGVFRVNLTTPSAVGAYVVLAQFKGSDVYNPSGVVPAALNVVKLDTALTLDAAGVANVTDTVNIEGTLKEASSGKGIGGASVIVYVNGFSSVVLTGSAGGYSYSFAANKSGDYKIIVYYNGNDMYYSASNSTSVAAVFVGSCVVLDPVGSQFANSNFVVSGRVLEVDSASPVSNVSVSVWIDGTSSVYNASTDGSGVFRVNLTSPGAVGTYSVLAEFDGFGKYGSSGVVSGTLNVVKLDTVLTLDAAGVANVTDTVNIEGVLSELDSNNPISNASLNISINNVNYTVSTDNNGKYSYSFAANKSGEYAVVVCYGGNGMYYSASNSTSVVAVLVESCVVLDSIGNQFVNSSFIVSGRVLEVAANNPISNASVSVWINGTSSIYNASTDGSGFFRVNLTSPGAVGAYSVLAKFDGFGKYGSSGVVSGTLNVVKLDTVLTLDAAGVVNVTDTVNVEGVLYEASSGNGIGGAEIIVSLSGANSTVLTDSDGKYSYSFAANKSGEYKIIACFKGNDTYYQSSNSTSVLATELNSYVSLDSIGSQFVDSSFIVSGRVLEVAANNPISNASVSVWINGTSSVYNVYAGSDGVFRVNLTAPNTVGAYSVLARFMGSDVYESSDVVSTALNVVKHDVVLTVDCPSIVNVTDTVNVEGTLKEASIGTIIGGAKIIVSIGGVNHTASTDSGGSYSYSFAANKSGQYKIIVSYGGNDEYNQATNSTSLTVTTKASCIIMDSISNQFVNSSFIVSGHVLESTTNNPISGVLVNVWINGTSSIYNVYAGSDGVFRVNLTSPGIVGAYSVLAGFMGSEVYESSDIASTALNVIKQDTALTINAPTNVNIKDTVTIEGILSESESNSAISNASLNISVNNINYTVKTDNNGKYGFSFLVNKSGTNEVTVCYPGSNKYNNANQSISFEAKLLKTSIKLDNMQDVLVNKPFNITGTVLNALTPVTEGKVYITIDKLNETYIADIDQNGKFITTINTLITAGKHNIKAIYEKTDVYDSSSSSATVNVTKQTAMITVSPITAMYKDNITFTANIFDNENNPITGGKVAFKLNGKTIKDANGNVIYGQAVNGVAQITATLSISPKEYVLNAVYSGNSIYGSDRTNSTLTIAKRAANIVLTAPSTASIGEKITLHAKITDGSNMANNGKVIFKVNGKALRDANGNVLYAYAANGEAILDYTIQKGFAIGKNNIEAVYINNGYEYLSAQTSITIIRSDIKISLNTLSITKGHNTTVTGKITDTYGNDIKATTNIAIKINGKTVNNTKINNGTINITIPTDSLEPNNYTITVVVGENSQYSGLRVNQTLTITN